MDTMVHGSMIEQEVLVTEEYGDEVLCAGWNPQLAQAAEALAADHAQQEVQTTGETETDTLLQRMYAFQG